MNLPHPGVLLPMGGEGVTGTCAERPYEFD